MIAISSQFFLTAVIKGEKSLKCECEWYVYAVLERGGDPETGAFEIKRTKYEHTNGCYPNTASFSLAKKKSGSLFEEVRLIL